MKAAQRVLNYQWGKDLNELDAAIPLMEQSLEHYRTLVTTDGKIQTEASASDLADTGAVHAGVTGKVDTNDVTIGSFVILHGNKLILLIYPSIIHIQRYTSCC